MNQPRSHDQKDESAATAIAQLKSLTDEELAQIAGESPNAFAQLYLRYVSNVYRYLLVRVGKIHDAEDLTTQTFLAALKNIGGYQGTGKFRSWLLGIARRRVADYFRQHRKTLPLELAEHIPDPNTPLEDYIEQQMRLEMVAAMLQTLTLERSEALALRLFGQLSLPEVAHVMGKSEAAVKMLISRAIRDLQKKIKAIQGENSSHAE